jgi:hypothetical protein
MFRANKENKNYRLVVLRLYQPAGNYPFNSAIFCRPAILPGRSYKLAAGYRKVITLNNGKWFTFNKQLHFIRHNL